MGKVGVNGGRGFDKGQLSAYTRWVIGNVRHNGLKRLFEDDDPSKLPAAGIEKISRVLARLNVARQPRDMDVPGFKLQPLKGDLRGCWAVSVRANWRIVFRFASGDAWDVDYLDYH